MLADEPPLVLAGTASVITPIEEARACAGLIPNARIVEIEGAEKPAMAAELLYRYLS